MKAVAFGLFGLILVVWTFDQFLGGPPLPKLVGNKTGEFFGDDGAFDQRVRAAYPAPYPLTLLTKDLAEQGFAVEGRTAVFEANDFPCRYSSLIFWQIDGDRATRLQGAFIPTCL